MAMFKIGDLVRLDEETATACGTPYGLETATVVRYLEARTDFVHLSKKLAGKPAWSVLSLEVIVPGKDSNLIDIWEVHPHLDTSYDYWVSAVSEDPDGRGALEYAKQVLEDRWDSEEEIENLDLTVRIRRSVMHKEDYEESQGE